MSDLFSKITLISLILALLGCNAKPDVRFDGLYQFSETKKSIVGDITTYNEYFRFYPDHTVINTLSSGGPKDVSVWLNKEFNGEVFSGIYKISGDSIAFSARRPGGNIVIKYKGKIEKDMILLTSETPNGYTSSHQYIFVPTKLN